MGSIICLFLSQTGQICSIGSSIGFKILELRIPLCLTVFVLGSIYASAWNAEDRHFFIAYFGYFGLGPY